MPGFLKTFLIILLGLFVWISPFEDSRAFAQQTPTTFSRVVRHDRAAGEVYIRAGADARFSRFSSMTQDLLGGDEALREDIVQANPGKIIFVCRGIDGTRELSRNPRLHDHCPPRSRRFWLVRGVTYRVPVARDSGAIHATDADSQQVSQLREQVRERDGRIRELERNLRNAHSQLSSLEQSQQQPSVSHPTSSDFWQTAFWLLLVGAILLLLAILVVAFLLHQKRKDKAAFEKVDLEERMLDECKDAVKRVREKFQRLLEEREKSLSEQSEELEKLVDRISALTLENHSLQQEVYGNRLGSSTFLSHASASSDPMPSVIIDMSGSTDHSDHDELIAKLEGLVYGYTRRNQELEEKLLELKKVEDRQGLIEEELEETRSLLSERSNSPSLWPEVIINVGDSDEVDKYDEPHHSSEVDTPKNSKETNESNPSDVEHELREEIADLNDELASLRMRQAYVEAEPTVKIKLPVMEEEESSSAHDLRVDELERQIAKLSGESLGYKSQLAELKDELGALNEALQEQRARIELFESHGRNMAKNVSEAQAVAGAAVTLLGEHFSIPKSPFSSQLNQVRESHLPKGPPNLVKEDATLPFSHALARLVDHVRTDCTNILELDTSAIVDLAHLMRDSVTRDPLDPNRSVPLRILAQYFYLANGGELPDRIRARTMVPPGGSTH